MPTVSTYGGRKVATERIPGVRKTAAETPTSEGAGLEEARAGKFGALARFGGTVAAVGEEAYKQANIVKQEEARKADELVLLARGNELDSFVNKTLYDPQSGALTVKGEASLGLSQRVGDEFEKFSGQIAQRLTSDRQRLAFERMRAQGRQHLDLTLEQHTFSEMQRFAGQELQAKVTNKVNEAMTYATQPQRIGAALNEALDSIRRFGPQIGMGPEEIKKRIDATTTQVHSGVIDQLLAQGHAKAAGIYFEETRGQINGEAIAGIEKAIDTADTAQLGLKTATDLWTAHGPKGDTDPINLDVMEDAAREKFSDDPKALEATIRFLRERKAGVDASRQDRAEATSGAVWVAASKGVSLDQISRMPEFLKLPGKAQAQVSDYIVGHANQAESRAAAAESRAYTRDLRAASKKEQQGWARYWDLSTPATLDATSENALQSLRGELGDEHVNRLLTQKRALAKSENVVREATIDSDLFNVTAESAGLDPYGKKSQQTDAERAELGYLKNAVETAIDVEQQKKGGILSRDEKQKVMRAITDQRVLITHNWFAADRQHVAATITNPDDRAKAYVPVTKIPPALLAQSLNYVRGLNSQTQQMPDGELQRRFIDRIQRAYALRLLGATRAEMEAVLQGTD